MLGASRLLVGLDPGVNTGFATSQARKLLTLETLDFWQAITRLDELHAQFELHVYIEDPQQNKPVFAKKDADNFAKKQRVAQNVGSNKRDAALLIARCEYLGIAYTKVPPKETKLTPAQFRTYSGWSGKCSQHAIDAGVLLLGR